MKIPSNLIFELLGVLVLLLLTPALMMTRTLRVSILSHPKMSIGYCVDCCTCDTSRVRLALLHWQTCVYIPSTLYYCMKQGAFFTVCSRFSPSLNDLSKLEDMTISREFSFVSFIILWLSSSWQQYCG